MSEVLDDLFLSHRIKHLVGTAIADPSLAKAMELEIFTATKRYAERFRRMRSCLVCAGKSVEEQYACPACKGNILVTNEVWYRQREEQQEKSKDDSKGAADGAGKC